MSYGDLAMPIHIILNDPGHHCSVLATQAQLQKGRHALHLLLIFNVLVLQVKEIGSDMAQPVEAHGTQYNPPKTSDQHSVVALLLA